MGAVRFRAMRIIIAALLITFGVSALGATSKDACQAQIPEQLRVSLTTKFPGYRLSLVTDNAAIDDNGEITSRGSKCLGVAIADFDGDGSKDYLLGLTSLSDRGALIVVALTRGSTWEFHTLDRWNDYRSSLYVATEKPGHFIRTEALDGPLEKGEKASMTCKNTVALFGSLESTGVVYCFSKGKWNHVWISD